MRKGEEDRGACKSHYQILFWIFPFPKSCFFFFFFFLLGVLSIVVIV